MKDFKRLQSRLQAMQKKLGTKTSRMEYLRSKSLNTRSKRLSNTPVWVERFSTSEIQKHSGRLINGTRSSRDCEDRVANFLKLILARI